MNRPIRWSNEWNSYGVHLESRSKILVLEEVIYNSLKVKGTTSVSSDEISSEKPQTPYIKMSVSKFDFLKSNILIGVILSYYNYYY